MSHWTRFCDVSLLLHKLGSYNSVSPAWEPGGKGSSVIWVDCRCSSCIYSHWRQLHLTSIPTSRSKVQCFPACFFIFSNWWFSPGNSLTYVVTPRRPYILSRPTGHVSIQEPPIRTTLHSRVPLIPGPVSAFTPQLSGIRKFSFRDVQHMETFIVLKWRGSFTHGTGDWKAWQVRP